MPEVKKKSGYENTWQKELKLVLALYSQCSSHQMIVTLTQGTFDQAKKLNPLLKDIGSPTTISLYLTLLRLVHSGYKNTKRIYILEEIYEQKKGNMSAGRIFPRALDLLDKWDLYHDHVRMIYDNAATWFQTEVAAQFSYGLEPCIKDVKQKEDRLSLIKDIFLEDMILISDDCPKFCWELENYRTDENGKIPKEDDHLIDAFRYMLAGAYYNRVERVDKDPNKILDGRRYATPENDSNSRHEQDPFGGIFEEYYI